MANATTQSTVTSKAWEANPATSQQRYALFKLTGDASYKTKRKFTGKMASDLIKELSKKASEAKKAKALPKVAKKAAPKRKTSKASAPYVLQGEGAKELKADLRSVVSHVKDASLSLRKSATSLSAAIDLLESLI